MCSTLHPYTEDEGCEILSRACERLVPETDMCVGGMKMGRKCNKKNQTHGQIYDTIGDKVNNMRWTNTKRLSFEGFFRQLNARNHNPFGQLDLRRFYLVTTKRV